MLKKLWPLFFIPQAGVAACIELLVLALAGPGFAFGVTSDPSRDQDELSSSSETTAPEVLLRNAENPNIAVVERAACVLKLVRLRPPIARVRFARTHALATLEVLLSPRNSLTNDSETTYEGALQSNGFYLKHLQNSIFQINDVVPGRELTFGENERHFWQIEAGHNVLSISPKQSNPDPARSRELLCRVHKRVLQEIQCVGLQDLIPFQDFEWRSNTFSASAPGNKINGTVFSLPGGAWSLNYTLSSATNDVCYVEFNPCLETTANCSIKFTRRLRRGDVLTRPIEYRVESIQYGVDANAQRGYLPLALRSNPHPLATLLVFTNNSRFIANLDGSLTPLDAAQVQAGLSGTMTDLNMLSLAIFIAAIGFCFLWISSKHSRQTKTTN